MQGKAIGVAIGCILGMFPLFFLNDDDEKKKAQKEAKEKTQPQPTLAPTESGKNWNSSETNSIWSPLEYFKLGLIVLGWWTGVSGNVIQPVTI